MPGKFEKFTERARTVFALAQEEAQRLKHNYIGTEHLLLGLVREGNGIAARVLANLGLQLPAVRAKVVETVGQGKDDVVGDPGLTPRAKKVIELAMDEARQLNNHYIGTEHLLLGLLREGEGIGAGVLESLGVSLENVRQQVMQVVSSSSSYQQQTPQTKTPDVDVTQEHHLLESIQAIVSKHPFTLQAQIVFIHAQEEAQRFNHNYIGTEHLLLGLVREGDGIAARVLTNLGVQLPKVRSAVQFIIGRGSGLVVGDPGLTPRTKKVIQLAADEARQLNKDYIGTEHLLLGLVREGEGIAAGVLESLGVGLEKVRQQVLQVVSASASLQTQQSDAHAIYRVWPTISDENVRRLTTLAQEMDCSMEVLIRVAIQLTWLHDDEAAADTDAPEPETPPGAEEGK